MPISKDTIQQIRETVDMHDLLQRLEMDQPKGGKIYAWNRAEEAPSVHIYRDHWWDYGTGKGGDQIAFVMDVLDVSFQKAVRIITRKGVIGGGKIDRPGKQVVSLTDVWNSQTLKDPFEDADVYEAYLSLLKSNWPGVFYPYEILSLPTVRLASPPSHRPGLPTAELWVAHRSYELGEIVGIKTRDLYTNRKRSVKQSVFTESLYFPYGKPAHRAGRLWLCEGESDAWALTLHKRRHPDSTDVPFDVAALPGGAHLWNDKFLEQCKEYGRVYVTMDSDDTGKKAAERIARELSNAGVWVEVFTLDHANDVCEAISLGWTPRLV